MSYRKNVTDKGQSELESATFNAGIPEFVRSQTLIVAKGAQTVPQRTTHSAGSIRVNAGVILPHDDKPDNFPSDTVGRP